MVGDFLESVVARHGDVRCRIGGTAEHHGILSVGIVMTGIGDAVEIYLATSGPVILHGGRIVVVAHGVSIRVAAFGQHPSGNIAVVVAQRGGKSDTGIVVRLGFFKMIVWDYGLIKVKSLRGLEALRRLCCPKGIAVRE